MLGPALQTLGSLAGLLIFGSAQVDGTLFARARTEVGSAPPAPDQENETVFATELRPGGTLNIETGRSQLLLGVEPRIYYRTPNLVGLDRPLLLYQANARYRRELSTRVRWINIVAASYGEVDYTSPDLAFTATTLPSDLGIAVIKRLTLDAESGFVLQLRPRAQLEAGAVVSHTKPIGFRAERSFPESTGVGIDLTQIYALSARSTIGFPVRPRYYFVSPGPDWMTLALGAGYRRQLDSITTIDALAGLQLAKVDGQSTSIFPRARLGYEHILFQRADTTVANRLQAYLDASLDPAIGDVRPTFGVMAELRSYFASDWMTEVSLTGDTTTTSSRSDVASQGETIGTARATLGYRLINELRLETGVRFSTRAANLFESDVEFSDEQVWGFLGITALLDFGRTLPGGAWTL